MKKMMFNINEETIQDECYLATTFGRGKSYFRQGRVSSLKFNYRDMIMEGVVRGSKIYEVRAVFDKEGNLREANCDCPAIGKYWGPCKHLVAFLLTIMEHDRRGNFDSLIQRNEPDPHEAAGKLLRLYEYASQYENRKPLTLEVTYEADRYHETNEHLAGSLSLKIGETRLYVVRSIERLLEAYNKSRILEYGKQFTYNPVRHTFSSEDEGLMDFLTEVYEVQGHIDNISPYRLKGMFSDKTLALTHAGAKRFFSIMEQRPFNLVYGASVLNNVQITKEPLPIAFDLDKKDEDFLLKADWGRDVRALTKDCHYILAGDKIHKLSQKQRLAFAPFYNTIKGRGDKGVLFPEKEGERLISHVIPYLERAAQVIIEPKIQDIIVREDLKAEAYLRPQKKGVACGLKFIYADREINPFKSQSKEEKHKDGKIVIRDMDREQKILDILNEYGFNVQPGEAHLDKEDSLFEFVYEGIPRLQELAHVYYSEDFKSFMTQRKFSYSGGIKLNSQVDMLEFTFKADDIDPGELADVLNALKEKKRYYRLKNGSFLNLEGEESQEITGLMEQLDIKFKDLSQEVIHLPKYRAMALEEQLKESGIKGFRRDKAFRELVSNINKPENLKLSTPKSLKGILRGYQEFGFKWLKTLSFYGMGGILADDMGLGKTLQVITLLLSDKEEKGSEPSLAIVPTSLVYNWEDEVKKFAPDLKTLILSGTKEERMEKLKDIEKADLVITSYPLIRRDGGDLKGFTFRYCILDEAQHIKNPGSLSAKTVKTIKAGVRFALTGTPMENTLSELWSIFDFIMPGYFYSQTKFRKQFESPIVRERDEVAAKRLSYHIKPFILRRLKGDVLKELPEKIEHRLTAELTKDQKKVYLAYMERIKADIEREIEEKGFNNSHIMILAGLTRLRQICCHPSTFLENYNGGSGKMELLGDIIDEALGGGHRILLFSQFTGMLDIIKRYLDIKQIEYLYLDGSTPTKERGQLVRDFNGGKGQIFLISLKAGGTGLNLTGADTVIHFDPWWNPAVEDQATDRAHRIGQKRWSTL